MILAASVTIKDWLEQHQTLLGWMGVISVLTFLITAVTIPILIARIPHDYFLNTASREDLPLGSHPALRLVLLILKNVLGLLILASGLAMLILPGQGILTIFIGMMLLNFPGKRRLELYLIRRPAIRRGVNWIRHRAHRRPLALPDAPDNRPARTAASRKSS